MPSNRRLKLLANSLALNEVAALDAETAAVMRRIRSDSSGGGDIEVKPGPSPPPASVGGDGAALVGGANAAIGSAATAGSAPPARRAAVNRFGTLSSDQRLQCRAAGQLRRHGQSPEAQAVFAAANKGDDGGPGSSAASSRCARDVDVLLIIDFEATCDKHAHDWPNEIIEFPVVALDARTAKVVGEFHSFVRPVINPRLTAFCTELTGIQQAQVDAAPPLQTVVDAFASWHAATFECQGIRTRVATDGPWDMRDFMYRQAVVRDGVVFPPLFYKWVNLRKEYATFFRIKPLGVGQMLTRLGLDFEGRQHSGIDDARNIARIAAALIRKGCRLNHVSSIDPDGPMMRFAEMARAIDSMA